MSESKTENSTDDQQKFIFGQNMEDRVVNVPADGAGDEEGPDSTQENGNAKNGDDGPPTLLRPSAFTPKPGILAPSRLGGASSNPFVSKSPVQNSSASDSGGSGGGNVLGSGLSQNPFASRAPSQAVSAPNSDSEDEKRDKPIVAPTHFGVSSTKISSKIGSSGLTTGNGATPSKFVLRPSALDHQTVNFGKSASDAGTAYKSSFKLEPAKLQSPFGSSKVSGGGRDDESSEAEAAAPVSAVSEEAAKQRLFGGVPDGVETQGSEADEAATKTNSADNEEETRSKSPSQPTGDSEKEKPDSGGAMFVFGQNMEERVANSKKSGLPSGEGSFVFGENLGERVSSTTKSPDTPEDQAKSPKAEDVDTPNKTLAESAAAHQAKIVQPELQEVEVKTGEENESNVFQINAKLFAFEKSSQSWLEKGRGLLRLNDMSDSDDSSFQSRLVMRTQGSLRVVLNTKIWPAMTVERASQKSIRITAVDSDDGSVRVFLVMANPKDADQIFSAIDWRVQQLKAQDQGAGEAAVESSQADSTVTESSSGTSQAEKRPNEDSPEENAGPTKKVRMDPSERREILTEESNDSSTIDPETEASNESFSSTNKSSSSE